MGPAARATDPASGGRVGARSRATPLIAYFDTSALIKLLVVEPGTEVAEELWDGASERVASCVVYAEARAALAAAARDRRLSARQLRNVVGGLGEACGAMQLVGVDAELAELAGELAEHHALRGYDAVHLATALEIETSELVIATWDSDLARAALAVGRTVVPTPHGTPA